MKAEFNAVDETADLGKYNAEFEAKHKPSPRHILSAIRAKLLIGSEKSQCEKEATSLLEHENVTFSNAIEIIETLKSWRSSETEAFKKAAQAKWPEVTRLA